MKEKNTNNKSNIPEESKTLDDYINFYTQMVRELSDILKEKGEIVQEIIFSKTDLNRTLDYRRRLEQLKNQKKLF